MKNIGPGKKVIIILIAIVIIIVAVVILVIVHRSNSISDNGNNILPPENEIIIDDKTWLFYGTETFTSHPANTNDTMYVYVSQTMTFSEDGGSMRYVYTYHVYKLSDSNNSSTDTHPSAENTIIPNI